MSAMMMLRTVTPISGPILADYHNEDLKKRSAGTQINLRKNQYIRVVEDVADMDLNPVRKEGDAVPAVSIPFAVIDKYQWLDRKMVKEVTFKQQTVAVADDGEITGLTGRQTIGLDDVMTESVTAQRTSQDSTEMEAEIDASMTTGEDLELSLAAERAKNSGN